VPAPGTWQSAPPAARRRLLVTSCVQSGDQLGFCALSTRPEVR
jgi:hypothetical protein